MISENALKAAGQAQFAVKAAEAKMSYTKPPILAAKFNSTVHADWKVNPTQKVVHFIRHGQGYHNLLAQVSRSYGAEYSETGDYDIAVKEQCPYMLPAIQDPSLTPIGRNDAKKLREIARCLEPELIICSPLRRAAETILIGFQDHSNSPIFAHEGCREQIGVFICDQRSSVSEYKEDGRYHRVDYSLLQSDEDILWQATRRETMVEMAERAHTFLMWIKNRPEREIVVGTHSAWLMAVFNVVLDIDSCTSSVEEAVWLRTFFDTGEMRSMLITF